MVSAAEEVGKEMNVMALLEGGVDINVFLNCNKRVFLFLKYNCYFRFGNTASIFTAVNTL